MEVFALHGPSGTGKSTNALAIAHKHNIPAIIDDGLLIYRGRKIAGTSAKYERTTIQAVKRAIFFDEAHAAAVRESIHDHQIKRILLLGTSRKMVDRIADALGLGPIDHYIAIDEVRSSSEIKAALYTRKTAGQHVIPIPYIQVEQDFFRRIISQGKKIFSPKKEIIGETTIVQPDFGFGRIHVSEAVLKKLIILSCSDIPEVSNVTKIQIALTDLPTVSFEIGLIASREANLPAIARLVRQRVYDTYINNLNIELHQIHITIGKLTMPGT
ncbi:AAA family ATPase [Aneurinibacillus tyrosinisolvens]|uniref:AAA family ATPase n=1 Tax=Aneurinibacillus tyrosinisolvens TaxID=1443435 RepID=UPI00063FB797|nr:AAA family ATPase [Aneurinibacillus tyrosinisolvens]